MLVISGSAAVGKTTLADALAKEFGFKLYNGGDILRKSHVNRVIQYLEMIVGFR